MKNTCWKCERRHVGCHATCEEYLAFKAEYEKEVIAYREKQQALEQTEEGIMLQLKKRFMDKKSFDDYPLAVELFDSLNPNLKALKEPVTKELAETTNEV